MTRHLALCSSLFEAHAHVNVQTNQSYNPLFNQSKGSKESFTLLQTPLFISSAIWKHQAQVSFDYQPAFNRCTNTYTQHFALLTFLKDGSLKPQLVPGLPPTHTNTLIQATPPAFYWICSSTAQKLFGESFSSKGRKKKRISHIYSNRNKHISIQQPSAIH